MSNNIQKSLYGSLLGTAVGDAYGLPFEGISPKRLAKLFKQDNCYHLIPFINGAMISDDTEHAVMTVQAYISSNGDVDKFRKSLKWRLVVWLIALPAGIVGLRHGEMMFEQIKGLWCEPVLRPSFFAKLSQQAEQAYQGERVKPIGFAGLRTVLRNGFFLLIVLLHGFRRLLPPY